MDTPLATNLINTAIAVATLAAVIVAMVGIYQNREQAKKSWLHSQQLATEERQHQSRPIVVPSGELTPFVAMGGSDLYMGQGTISWIYPGKVQLELQNMGGGVALNVHCVLYGSDSQYDHQFVSWDNGPIGKDPVQVVYEHPQQFCLSPDDSIDGVYHLYDTSLNSPSNPARDRIACLTITYHDLFEIKHVSIFNYTLEHRWVCKKVGSIPPLKEKSPLDLKELNDWQRQHAPKWSAPPILTQDSQGI